MITKTNVMDPENILINILDHEIISEVKYYNERRIQNNRMEPEEIQS